MNRLEGPFMPTWIVPMPQVLPISTDFSAMAAADNCCLTRFYHHTLLEYLYLVRRHAQPLKPTGARSVRKAALGGETPKWTMPTAGVRPCASCAR
jgi:hypothetical protein